jgi:hypothetical protein
LVDMGVGAPLSLKNRKKMVFRSRSFWDKYCLDTYSWWFWKQNTTASTKKGETEKLYFFWTIEIQSLYYHSDNL